MTLKYISIWVISILVSVTISVYLTYLFSFKVFEEEMTSIVLTGLLDGNEQIDKIITSLDNDEIEKSKIRLNAMKKVSIESYPALIKVLEDGWLSRWKVVDRAKGELEMHNKSLKNGTREELRAP